MEQEIQSATKERTPATKDKTQQTTLEYKLLVQYHSNLAHVPSLVNLISYFVAAKIITSSDAEAITNTIIIKSQIVALRKLLNKVLSTFLHGHGDSKLFDEMLKIMQIYGDDSVQILAADMLGTIVKKRSAVPITSGMQLRMYINSICILNKNTLAVTKCEANQKQHCKWL